MAHLQKNILVTGFSGGAGKSFLIKTGLIPIMADQLVTSISHTTRNLRGTEEDGKEYFKISVGDFEKKVSEHFFLEHTHPHAGVYYGSSVEQYECARANNKYLAYDVDYKGFEQLNTGALKGKLINVGLLTPVWQRIKWMKARQDMPLEKMLQRIEYSDMVERSFFEKNLKKFDVVEEYTEKTNYGLLANKIINLACL